MGDLGFDVFAKAALETRRALENFKRSFEAHGGSGPFLNFSTVFSRWVNGFGTYGACSALKEALIHIGPRAIQGRFSALHGPCGCGEPV
jgi:hypothetical protein